MILIALRCNKQIWGGGGVLLEEKYKTYDQKFLFLTIFCLTETEHNFVLLLSEINTDVSN
jgi:hypothetical protein